MSTQQVQELERDGTTVSWRNRGGATTQYLVERSTDSGLTFAVEATVVQSTSGVEYLPDSDRFSVTVAGMAESDIIRVTPSEASGPLLTVYSFGAADPSPVCTIFGVVKDTVRGQPHAGARIIVRPVKGGMSQWQGNDGVPAHNNQSEAATTRPMQLESDENGQWQIELVRDLIVEINIPSIGHRLCFRVPKNRDVLNFRDAYQYRVPVASGSKQFAGASAHGPFGTGGDRP